MFKEELEKCFKNPSILMLIIIVIACEVGLLLGGAVGGEIYAPDGYKDLVDGRLPQQLLVQDEADELYLMSTKKQAIKPLGLSADLFGFNETYNQLYLVKFGTEETVISLLKKYKDMMIEAEEIKVPLVLSEDCEWQMKLSDQRLYLMNLTENVLTVIDLKPQENKGWPSYSQVALDFEVQSWEVNDEAVYFAVTDQVMMYSYDSGEVTLFLEERGLHSIQLYQNYLTVTGQFETMGFMTFYDRVDGHMIDGSMFESSANQVFDSSNEEPFVYVTALNLQGGIAIEAVEVTRNESYFLQLSVNQMKTEPIFYKGYGYYVNNDDQVVIYEPSTELLTLELEQKIKCVYPFY